MRTTSASRFRLRIYPKRSNSQSKLGGINCTIPHKKAVIPLLDEIDTAARDLHSVNTVALRDGKAIGFNTDILMAER